MNPLTVAESESPPVSRQSSNRLLASLNPADYQRLRPHLKYRPLKPRQILYKSGDRLTDVYFPDKSLCSIVNTMDDGSSVEVAMVGDEGHDRNRRRAGRADRQRRCRRSGRR